MAYQQGGWWLSGKYFLQPILNGRCRFPGGIAENHIGVATGFIMSHESNPCANILKRTGLVKVRAILSEKSVMRFEFQEDPVKIFSRDAVFSGDP